MKKHVYLLLVCLTIVSWNLRNVEAIEEAPTVETVLPWNDFSEPFNMDKWDKSGNVALEEIDEDGNQALRISMDLSQRINGWCQINFDKAPETGRANAFRFRYKSSGSNSQLKFWLAIEMPNGEPRNYSPPAPVMLSNTDWETMVLPFTYFRVPYEAVSGRMLGFCFILERGFENPEMSDAILIDDLEMVYHPSIENKLIEITTDEQFFSLIDLNRPELKTVKASLDAGNLESAKAAFVKHMQTRSAPIFYADFNNREAILETYAELYGGDFFSDTHFKKRALEYYNYVLDSGANVLKFPDGNILWSYAENGAPWTWTAIISRFYMFRDLGMAYWASNDEGYADRAWDYYEDYTEKWPLQMQGEIMPRLCGWLVTMGIEERLHYWMLGYQFLKDAEVSTVDRQIDLFKRMIEHAQWLLVVSEMGYRPGNHQIVEVATLSEASIFLNAGTLAPQWQETAFALLKEHLDREVLADGAYLELTPGYHTWCAERFIAPARLAQMNGVKMPEGFYEKTRRMYEWLVGFIPPDRIQVAVGDAPSSDMRRIMAVAAALFESPTFAFLADGHELPRDWFWFIGADGAHRYQELEPQEPDFLFYNPEPSRFIAMRSGWDKQAHFLFFNVTPDAGGHGHPDSLSVDVSAFGQTILKDIGSLGYSNPMHAQVAVKTRAHSVLTVDGRDMLTVRPEYLDGGVTGGIQWAAGAMDWHNDIRHERRVAFVPNPGYFIIEDKVSGSGSHKIEQLWRFAPNISVEMNATAASVTGTAKGKFLEIRGLFRSECSMYELDGLPDYDGKPGCAIFGEQVELPYRQVFVLLPGKEGSPAPDVNPEQVEAILSGL